MVPIDKKTTYMDTVAELGGDQQVPWPPLWHGLAVINFDLRLILIEILGKNSFVGPP
jgi:hypothetical protein